MHFKNEQEIGEDSMPDGPKKDDANEKIVELGKHARTTVKKAWDYAWNLPNDTIAYIFLALGMFLFFISPIFGGAIVGVVVGLSFTDQITEAIRAAKGHFQEEPVGRSIVFLSLLVILIYALSTLFLGALAAVGVKSLVRGDSKKKRP